MDLGAAGDAILEIGRSMHNLYYYFSTLAEYADLITKGKFSQTGLNLGFYDRVSFYQSCLHQMQLNHFDIASHQKLLGRFGVGSSLVDSTDQLDLPMLGFGEHFVVIVVDQHAVIPGKCQFIKPYLAG